MVTLTPAEDFPNGTVTEAGTVAYFEFDESLTTTPPLPAFASSVTVAVDFAPPVTELGFSTIEESSGGVRVRGAVFVVDPTLAVTEIVFEAFTAVVKMLNDAEFCPA